MSAQRETGTVKWFNTSKGYGFITPDRGGSDVFVHVTELQKVAIETIGEGDRLEFEVTTKNKSKKPAAVNIRKL